jgi:hypothetical protein
MNTNPQRSAKDELERRIIHNINDFGWHAVNVIEDDGHPPWTVLRLAGLFGRPALARHRRVKGVTLTATLRCPAPLRPSLHIHVQSFGRSDEILYLVGKTSDLTLPDFVRCHFLVAILPYRTQRKRVGRDMATKPQRIATDDLEENRPFQYCGLRLACRSESLAQTPSPPLLPRRCAVLLPLRTGPDSCPGVRPR